LNSSIFEIMKRRLPPLLAIRAFEAAGRHLSFTRAAEELNVTQGAISRHLKTLESYLQQPLFERLTRRIAFTSFGRRYFLAVSAGLDAIEHAAPAPSGKTTLKLSITQSMGSLWLLPRLSSFTDANQDIEVIVDMSIQPVDFERDHTDLAIRLGKLPGTHAQPMQPVIPHLMVKSWNGVAAEHLYDEVLTPVLSKKLLLKGGRLKQPRDLLRYPLIQVTLRPEAWQEWFKANGVTRLPKAEMIECGHFFMALEAAAKHRGMALVPAIYVENLGDRRHLVCPFKSTLKSCGGYYLLYRESDANSAKIRRFRDWVFAHKNKSTPPLLRTASPMTHS
jgi:LysR family glycine cleavage system transcriptional activator